jgi:hypothetical protein
MRIVVTWNGTEDFDAHLEIPVSDAQGNHLWWGVDQNITNDFIEYTDIVSSGDYVSIDTDNVDGIVATCTAGTNNDKCGPETITISKIRSGAYRYHVHDYRGRGNNTTHIADNGTYVQVFYDNKVTNFYPPSTAGDLWTVFDFDNSSGFTRINTLSSESNAGNVDNH